ncbi:hypothetical protein [Prosthecodimorpha staleyi]|uniref:Uncharacterized protein n=1 Tax=Prosthecodimorpha staleyi TaxID=2840188 RepID=A0A947D076_9HYPH|nr:hypothetical protein [Prosthecodimorpha staleyi]MBT9287964.1 hypothetical protein [Prosthecodimorpha staleyi]
MYDIFRREKAKKDVSKIYLFGIEVGGWGAALALLLSVIGLVWQAWGYVIGPDVRIYPIRSLEFTCSHQNGSECKEDANLIVVVDRLALANFGAQGFDASVDPGEAQLDLLDVKDQVIFSIILTAQYYTERTQISIEQKSASKIFLKTGSGVDFEVAYYPRMKISVDGKVDRKNFIIWSDFKNYLEKGVNGKEVQRIRVTLKPSALGRNWSTLKATCIVVADERMRNSNRDPLIGTIPRDCADLNELKRI